MREACFLPDPADLVAGLEQRDVTPLFARGSLSQRPAYAVLARTSADRIVVQDYCPLAESIEWRLGQRYWQERGTNAFRSDATPVPYVINNDGTLSRNAAEVLFASLTTAERAGSLPSQVFTLELGIGVGLFARYFLDEFHDLCLRHGKDYYNRLCYIAGDCSERMLRDACRNGVFAHHPGRYRLRVVNALKPEESLVKDATLTGYWPRPLWAVFLNYVLDCLPTTVLELTAEEVRELRVRTCLARGVKLEEFTDLTAEQLAELAQSPDTDKQRELVRLYGLFASEYDYRPVDVGAIPFGDFAVEFARPRAKRLVLNYGAMQSLERLTEMVADQGFILINDYGQTQLPLQEEYEHQRFSKATSIGLCFPLLKAYFADSKQCAWVEPLEENEHIHARLLSRCPDQETVTRFAECFGNAAQDAMQEPVQRAHQLAEMGRLDAAASSYAEAVQRQPYNWRLMGEIAEFLTFSLQNAKAGIDMAKVGLRLNPCSSELWNALGDSLFEFGRIAEARQAYLRTLRINSSDVRARYSLAWVHEREKNYLAGLERIAEALALDQAGYYRERLLRKQSEILDRLSLRHYQEALRTANRISTASSRRDGGKSAGSNVGLPPVVMTSAHEAPVASRTSK